MSAFSTAALFDPSAYARPERFHALFRSLRAQAPVTKVEMEGFPPFWLVTRHDDIKAIENDAATFLAGPRTILQSLAQEKVNLEKLGDRNGLKTLVHMDGDEHRKHRMIAQGFFNRSNIEKLRAQTERQADIFIDKMAAMDGACDFASDIAFWFPLRVVMSIMGVPREDDAHLLKLTQQLFGFMDPDLGYGQEQGEMGVIKVIGDFSAYVNALIAERRARPADDLATVLATAEIDGQPIDAFKQLSYFILVTTAGHDTTSASIAEGMNALIDDPAAMARLKAEPDLCATAADEFVRLAAPVRHFLRTPVRDVRVAGVDIKAGETLMLAFWSAARDETQFANPDGVTVDRPVNQHLAFGYGPHVCLGKHLARMEIEVFFRRLLPRLADIERAGAVQYMESGFVSGIKKMPVRYKMR
ncbi:MAG TPA: cytochrome P450 [Parvularcula sp.]|nr:cytochrome P450 [Parvularcula sp.]HBS34146.1 cytochrome P450 [Parvularcula sp.]